MWLEGFLNALSGTNLLWLGMGSIIGLVVGVLPALGANFAVALMLPFTFGMDPVTAILFLVAIHASANYGDSIASIVINVPGGPGTVATCWDGYPLARKGKAGMAVGIATLASFIGGAGTWLFLAVLVGPVTRFALSIGAPEYFALGFMALGLISVASRGETIKGVIMALFGLALSCVGQDEATGLTFRFSFGVLSLEAGIPIVVSTLGIFALSQVIVMLEEGGTISKAIEVKDSILSGFPQVLKRPLTLVRAGTVGWFIGILPALGVSVAGILAYFFEKKYSKEKDQFGQGAPSGLVAAEVGKGACVVGDLIPTFTLGVPGSVTGAILMGALIIQGIEPGPRFLLMGAKPYTVFAGIVISQAIFLVSGVVLGKVFTRIIHCPNMITAPMIAVLTFLGAFAERNNPVDISLALVFGIFAYALEKLRYSPVCFVLGLILGPLVEANFHRSLGISFGSYAIFFTRPIAVTMLAITVLFLVGPYLYHLVRKGSRPAPGSERTASMSKPMSHGIGEVVLLAVITSIFTLFLVTARRYTPPSRLFPNLVCGFGLVFILWRVLAIIRSVSFRPLNWTRFGPLFRGSLGWQWSVLTMAGLILCMYTLGFVVGSLVYITGVILLGGDRKRGRALTVAALTAVSTYVLAKIVHLQLPTGFFTFIR